MGAGASGEGELWGCEDRALPGAAGGARAGVCDGHARSAGRGVAHARPGGGGGTAADDFGLVPEVTHLASTPTYTMSGAARMGCSVPHLGSNLGPLLSKHFHEFERCIP